MKNQELNITTQVFILSGAPGSGKSHLARYMEENMDAETVSADYYMTENGEYKFDVSKLSDAHKNCFRDFCELIDEDEVPVIVVDNTNIDAYEIAPYLMYAQINQCEVIIIELHGEFKNIHGVGEFKVEMMREKMKTRNLPFHMKSLVKEFKGY